MILFLRWFHIISLGITVGALFLSWMFSRNIPQSDNNSPQNQNQKTETMAAAGTFLGLYLTDHSPF